MSAEPRGNADHISEMTQEKLVEFGNHLRLYRDELNAEKQRLDKYAQKLQQERKELEGIATKLKKRIVSLNEKDKELNLRCKHVLTSIREQLSAGDGDSEEQVRVLRQYEDILRWMVKDINDDIDEIMG